MRHVSLPIAAVLTAAMLSPAAAQPGEPASVSTSSRTITLITGDRVLVDDQGHVQRVDSRPDKGFTQYIRDGHQYVVPDDAVDDLLADRIDNRFFDITALNEFGYDDSRTDGIPLLSDRPGHKDVLPKARAASRWAERTAAVNKTGKAEKLWLDGKSRVALDESVPVVGGDEAWKAGFDGAGVTIAVLDTGFDETHPDLKDVVSSSKSFVDEPIKDLHGHGTHVASIAAGRGSKYTGVAKGARVAVGKVCSDDGACLDSAMISGMEWAAREVGAKVVNISIAGPQTDGTDPLSQALDRISAETGTLFVVAAGNEGGREKVSRPASANEALAVANLTKRGELNPGSSRGPRFGDFAVKPDIGAPGTDIAAARAAGSSMGVPVDDTHTRESGTSMAAPHVAGAAAVLSQRHPDWTARELKAHLMTTVKAGKISPAETGTGLLDVNRAVTQQMRVSTGSVSFGLLKWPHSEPSAQTITYRNDGENDVTLALRHDLGAVLTVPESVTVPARGAAEVVVTFAPGKESGPFYGRLRATADGVDITVSVGGHAEPNMHKLKVIASTRDGKPAGRQSVNVIDLKTRQTRIVELDLDGTVNLDLPESDYALLGRIYDTSPAASTFKAVAATDFAGRVALTDDRTVDLAAAEGRQVSVDLADGRVKQLKRRTTLAISDDSGDVVSKSTTTSASVPVFTLSIGEPLPGLRYNTMMEAAQPTVSFDEYGFLTWYTASSARFAAGKHELRTARADGDVSGALVVVESLPLDIIGLARELQQRGAAAVLLLGATPFPPDAQTAIPVLTAADHEATELVAKMGDKITITATDGSLVNYHLYFPERAALPAGRTYRVRREQVAEVKSSYHDVGTTRLLLERNYPTIDGKVADVVPGGQAFGPEFLEGEWFTAPVTRTDYYSAGGGVEWYQEVFVGRDFAAGPGEQGAGNWVDRRSARYEPGGTYERAWGAAVASPRLTGPPFPWWGIAAGVVRSSDQIQARVSPFGFPAAVESWQQLGTGSVELKRDGVSLGVKQSPAIGEWTVPDGGGRYELSLRAHRDTKLFDLSPDVSTTWSFTSSKDGQGKLPLIEVDYTVPLDSHNSVDAAVLTPLRIRLLRQDGVVVAVEELATYASFDDGLTWKRFSGDVPAEGASGGHVSLRVVATDTNGNSVDQTVIRAYRLK